MNIIAWNVLVDGQQVAIKFFADSCTEEQVLRVLKNTKEFRGKNVTLERRGGSAPSEAPAPSPASSPEPEVNPEFYSEPEPEPEPEQLPPPPEEVVVPIESKRKPRSRSHEGGK